MEAMIGGMGCDSAAGNPLGNLVDGFLDRTRVAEQMSQGMVDERKQELQQQNEAATKLQAIQRRKMSQGVVKAKKEQIAIAQEYADAGDDARGNTAQARVGIGSETIHGRD